MFIPCAHYFMHTHADALKRPTPHILPYQCRGQCSTFVRARWGVLAPPPPCTVRIGCCFTPHCIDEWCARPHTCTHTCAPLSHAGLLFLLSLCSRTLCGSGTHPRCLIRNSCPRSLQSALLGGPHYGRTVREVALCLVVVGVGRSPSDGPRKKR
jgi:hypothetical protein